MASWCCETPTKCENGFIADSVTWLTHSIMSATLATESSSSEVASSRRLRLSSVVQGTTTKCANLTDSESKQEIISAGSRRIRLFRLDVFALLSTEGSTQSASSFTVWRNRTQCSASRSSVAAAADSLPPCDTRSRSGATTLSSNSISSRRTHRITIMSISSVAHSIAASTIALHSSAASSRLVPAATAAAAGWSSGKGQSDHCLAMLGATAYCVRLASSVPTTPGATVPCPRMSDFHLRSSSRDSHGSPSGISMSASSTPPASATAAIARPTPAPGRPRLPMPAPAPPTAPRAPLPPRTRYILPV
mmetsp:Transcript_15887/g.55322  ORF Transcript_15887/g.55322 Transcript_15887/m.55322 type:complete len:306 (+) Transcript_15887:1612-2529(+)